MWSKASERGTVVEIIGPRETEYVILDYSDLGPSLGRWEHRLNFCPGINSGLPGVSWSTSPLIFGMSGFSRYKFKSLRILPRLALQGRNLMEVEID